MTNLFSRWLPCATLAAWSGILLYFSWSGRISAFLHPMFRPGVIVAGLAMVIMAFVFVLVPVDAGCCTTGNCSHPLSRKPLGKLLTFLILLLPITAAALFSPDGFGRSAMLNRGVISDASVLPPPPANLAERPKPLSEPPLPTKEGSPQPAVAAIPQATPANDYIQRTPEGNIVAEVLDLLYAAQDNMLRADFEGKTVELVGQLMPDTANNASGNRFKAVRMFMTCCAADARPVATLVESPQKPELREMSWIKVTGKATFPIENGRRTAVLKADRVEKTAPPEESMLY
jgi:uncharacterized repeat protein (TIGR03943 family)